MADLTLLTLAVLTGRISTDGFLLGRFQILTLAVLTLLTLAVLDSHFGRFNTSHFGRFRFSLWPF